MQNEIAKACRLMSVTPYDVICNACEYLPEDLRDVVDPRDVFRRYVETGSCPDWVQDYVTAVIEFDPNMVK